MNTFSSSTKRAMWAACVALAAFASTATANIDLFFAPVEIFSPGPTCTAGSILTVQLRARSSTAAPEEFSGLSVILEWDPTKLQFMENIPNGGSEYIWSSEFFPAGGLNPNYADGDASYYAAGQIFTLPSAPGNASNGMLVTTFKFMVLAPTDASSLVMIPSRAGELTQTSDINANDTTGDISGTATFVVANACDCLLGDVDIDSDYDFLDIDAAVNVLLGLDTDPGHINAVDADCDGDADGDDIQGFLNFMLLAL